MIQKEILQQEINEAEQKIKENKGKLQNLKNLFDLVYPEDDVYLNGIDTTGHIYVTKYSIVSQPIFRIGNLSITEEEAKKEKERRILKTEINQYIDRENKRYILINGCGEKNFSLYYEDGKWKWMEGFAIFNTFGLKEINSGEIADSIIEHYKERLNLLILW